MTGLQRWRKIAKSLIVISLTWEVAATIVSLVLLMLVMVQGGEAPSSERLIPLVGTIGIIGVVTWAIWHARKRRQDPEPLATAVEEG